MEQIPEIESIKNHPEGLKKPPKPSYLANAYDVGKSVEYLDKLKEIRESTHGVLVSIRELGIAEAYKFRVTSQYVGKCFLREAFSPNGIGTAAIHNAIKQFCSDTVNTTVKSEMKNVVNEILDLNNEFKNAIDAAISNSITNQINQYLKILDQRSLARILNSQATKSTDKLTPVPHQQTGKLPTNFPKTREELMRLSDTQLNDLLSFYGEEIPEIEIDQKRAIFAQYIGLLL